MPSSDVPSPRLSWFAIVFDHMRPIRLPLSVVAIGVAATLAVEQVSELFLMTTLSDAAFWPYLWLLLASALNGLAIWYHSRNAYRLRYPRWPALQHPRGCWLRAWLPRLLGAAVPLLIAVGCLLAYARIEVEPDHELALAGFVFRVLGFIALAAILLVFFITRRRLINLVAGRGRGPGIHARPEDEDRVDAMAELGRAPKFIFLMALLLNILLAVLIAFQPYWLNPFGPLAILLLAGTFLCITGGYVTLWADRVGFPVLSVIAAFALVWHWWLLNDNHLVRLHPGMTTHARTEPGESPPAARRFDEHWPAWLQAHCGQRQPCPVVLIASEGGGIRAAAWTAVVLAELEKHSQTSAVDLDVPSLLRSTFAVSGVSGGSLGLATVVALNRDAATLTAPGDLGERAETFLTHDFLAPTLANLFFVDFTQRLLPGAWFNDRGRALTDAWESAYAQLGAATFSRPLRELYGDVAGQADRQIPALFLNSTVVGNGHRFVQHPFDSLPNENAWYAAVDSANYATAAMPLSEAVLNSSRFTYVSPAGTLGEGDNALQLVDGGYFENSGATTLLDVIRAMRSRAGGHTLQFRILHISNDPGVESFAPSYAPAGAKAEDRCEGYAQPDRLSGDVSVPLVALMATRGARGSYARQALVRALGAQDRFWHFRLCQGRYAIPLGWTISPRVFDEMRRQLHERYDVAGLAAEALRVVP